MGTMPIRPRPFRSSRSTSSATAKGRRPSRRSWPLLVVLPVIGLLGVFWLNGCGDRPASAEPSVVPTTTTTNAIPDAQESPTAPTSQVATPATVELAKPVVQPWSTPPDPAANLPETKEPWVSHLGLVAPDCIDLTVEAQWVVPANLVPYVAEEGDLVEKMPGKADRTYPMATLKRGGHPIGYLQGPKLEWFSRFEEIGGDPLPATLADDAANYVITSTDDPAFATAQHPQAVFRKTKPTDWQQRMNNYPTRHHLYLRLAQPMQVGKTYVITVAQLGLREPTLTLTIDESRLRSDAIHVNQIGFRPDDPGKRAFLSTWLGTGGAMTYPADTRFSVIDDASGAEVFSGTIELALAAEGSERFAAKQVPNISRTAVYRMDFAELTTPGRYRISIDGIGSSYPFSIADTVWEHAFLIQMRGLYNNRCGVDLGQPWTAFTKPRDFHPEDGTLATRTTYDVLAKGDHAYGDFSAGDTGEAVPQAWGGYHDAGDWNPRRVSHMTVTLAQLEMMELYPDYFGQLDLHIPSEAGIPDIVTEALFELDCFRRLQQPDGGIPFGIESDGDPLPGEISWLSSQKVFISAPNICDSWLYAAVAARAAKVLRPFDAQRSAMYQDSAERAFAWADADYTKRKADGSLDRLKDLWLATDHRNLSSLILYELTGEKIWHDRFLENTCLKDADPAVCWYGKHIQCDAAFLYCRLPEALADPTIKANAKTAVLKMAKVSLDYAANNAFEVTNKDPHRPLFCGVFSTSGGTELARAHYLTGEVKYLTGVIRSCQFQSGCNPNNLVYTTGLGMNPVRHPLQVDARNTGQAVPEGLTVFGNLDYWNWKGGFWDWPVKFINKPEVTWPDAYDWPLSEAYFDIDKFVSMNEFVIDTWTPNVWVWGYLAARKPLKPAAQ